MQANAKVQHQHQQRHQEDATDCVDTQEADQNPEEPKDKLRHEDKRKLAPSTQPAGRKQRKASDKRVSRPPPEPPEPKPESSTGHDNICAGCLKPIRECYLLVALDKQWHEDCLKCACCDCRLGEVGSSLFTHSDKILCRRDFLRIFGQHGQCAACKESIPPYEMVMRANDNAYHMDCFACQQCQYRFCVGDRFHLTERHRVVCVLCHSDSAPAPAPNNRPQAEAQEQASSVAATRGALEKVADELALV